MTPIQTRWITSHYDPLKPVPAPKPVEAGKDTRHHLIYAAMLDGVRSKIALGDYTGLADRTVGRLQKDLARAGYIRIGRYRSRPCYVLAEDENTYIAALTPEDVQEIGILANTRGYTHADLAKHFSVQKWVISDALQGRKQYSESRV